MRTRIGTPPRRRRSTLLAMLAVVGLGGLASPSHAREDTWAGATVAGATFRRTSPRNANTVVYEVSRRLSDEEVRTAAKYIVSQIRIDPEAPFQFGNIFFHMPGKTERVVFREDKIFTGAVVRPPQPPPAPPAPAPSPPKPPVPMPQPTPSRPDGGAAWARGEHAGARFERISPPRSSTILYTVSAPLSDAALRPVAQYVAGAIAADPDVTFRRGTMVFRMPDRQVAVPFSGTRIDFPQPAPPAPVPMPHPTNEEHRKKKTRHKIEDFFKSLFHDTDTWERFEFYGARFRRLSSRDDRYVVYDVDRPLSAGQVRSAAREAARRIAEDAGAHFETGQIEFRLPRGRRQIYDFNDGRVREARRGRPDAGEIFFHLLDPDRFSDPDEDSWIGRDEESWFRSTGDTWAEGTFQGARVRRTSPRWSSAVVYRVDRPLDDAALAQVARWVAGAIRLDPEAGFASGSITFFLPDRIRRLRFDDRHIRF